MKLANKVAPWLGFGDNAAEAAAFYVSKIPGSRIIRTVNNPATGTPLVVEFELGGMPVCALNMGQDQGSTHAFSLSISCDSQEEIDTLWAELGEGGQEVGCGWLTDRYGFSWQIVPTEVSDWLSDVDTAKSGRMLAALVGMVKLDKAVLEAAFNGEADKAV